MPDTFFMPGMIIGIEGGGTVIFQWNPSTVSRKKDNDWARLEPAGREAPIYHFGCGKDHTYTFTADLSRENRGPSFVKGQVDSLFKFMEPSKKGQGLDRPPLVMLILGTFVNIQGFVQSVSAEYGPMYNPWTLSPYDAKFTITIVEVKE